jgi:hypothetical protein
MSDRRAPTLERSRPKSDEDAKPRSRAWSITLIAIAGIVVAGLLVLVVPLLFSGGDGTGPIVDPIDTDVPPDVDEPVAPDPIAHPGGLSAAAADTAAAIQAAVEVEDWEALAELALEGEMPFTATFGEELTTVDELASYWRGLNTEEDLPRIMTALLTLPNWTSRAPDTADGLVIHVTPAFMHNPSVANQRALEDALSAEWLDMQMADGQYLGWRIGINEDGDWLFFVQGD